MSMCNVQSPGPVPQCRTPVLASSIQGEGSLFRALVLLLAPSVQGLVRLPFVQGPVPSLCVEPYPHFPRHVVQLGPNCTGSHPLLNMFKRAHFEVQTVGGWMAGIRLKYLPVFNNFKRNNKVANGRFKLRLLVNVVMRHC